MNWCGSAPALHIQSLLFFFHCPSFFCLPFFFLPAFLLRLLYLVAPFLSSLGSVALPSRKILLVAASSIKVSRQVFFVAKSVVWISAAAPPPHLLSLLSKPQKTSSGLSPPTHPLCFFPFLFPSRENRS